MPELPTLFAVTDIETTLKYKIAFDVAWRITDRNENEYGKGSYVIKDSFNCDVPFFKEKLGHYFDDTYAHLLTPVNFNEARDIYNQQVLDLQNKGYNVIFCAYNASFDTKHLSITSEKLTGKKFLGVKMKLMDIWYFWALSCPRNYKAEPTKSKKFLSTSAESVYRFEAGNPDFIEKHIAWHDVRDETFILLKTLARKKKMPIVDNPTEFVGGVYRIANERLGIDGTKELVPA